MCIRDRVDKKIGKLNKETGDRIDGIREEMEEANKNVMKEIKVLKKTKLKTPAEEKKTVERMTALEKKIGDMESKGQRPKPLITEDDYGIARRSLVLAPIPHKRGATLED